MLRDAHETARGIIFQEWNTETSINLLNQHRVGQSNQIWPTVATKTNNQPVDIRFLF